MIAFFASYKSQPNSSSQNIILPVWEYHTLHLNNLITHRRPGVPPPSTLPPLLRLHLRLLHLMQKIGMIILSWSWSWSSLSWMMIITLMMTCRGRCDCSWHWRFSEKCCRLLGQLFLAYLLLISWYKWSQCYAFFVSSLLVMSDDAKESVPLPNDCFFTHCCGGFNWPLWTHKKRQKFTHRSKPANNRFHNV